MSLRQASLGFSPSPGLVRPEAHTVRSRTLLLRRSVATGRVIFRTRPTHSAAMATLWRQLQLMALAESPPAHFRVSPTGVRSILPCTVKLQFGVNKVRKRGSVQNRRDALFRTGSVGGAAELVTCERERSNRRARRQLCGCGFSAFRSALRSHAGSERYASAGATGPGVSSISGIGNVLNPPP